MTLPTFPSATDEMLGLFKAAWDALAPALNGGTAPEVQWPGKPATEPGADVAFARVTIKHGRSRQATFGAPGWRRFVRPGQVIVQVFAPLSGGQPLSLAQNLAIIARDAYEGVGTASGILFRNARVEEVGVSNAWLQMNMSVEFEYDEMR